ncbi:MAG: tRNA guanosine(34) transglycosylase Tgt [Anaerolineaceae bacterium]
MTLSEVKLRSGTLKTPVFLPDATLGVVRSVDSSDLEDCGITAVVMNTFHLMQRPGSSTIQSLGGLHKMSSWNGPIMTDSGGFQAYSLIRQNPKFGQIHEKGISFQPEGSTRKYQLTPEKTVQLQMSYDSDIVVCLDEPTHVDEDYQEQMISVQRTIAWARKSRKEFDRLVDQKGLTETNRPRLFAVVQGGGFKDLRKACADALLEIGFDGYGFGGWPLDSQMNLLTDIVGYTREIIPPEFPFHGLGIGHPENIAASYAMGYEMFDSAMPTRDARHGRLYAFTTSPEESNGGLDGKWLRYLYINDEKMIKDGGPLSEFCDCLTCRRYSRSYLHHLFKIGDSLYYRLATMHNLRFMVQLCDRLRMRAA